MPLQKIGNRIKKTTTARLLGRTAVIISVETQKAYLEAASGDEFTAFS